MPEYGFGFYGFGLYGVGSSEFPYFVDEVAFASNPFDSPQIWTNLTGRARTRAWSRGRQTEAASTDTGRAAVVFENLDRALDPVNVASVYYPNVLPMRRVRCRAVVDGTEYILYTCFIDPEDGWQLSQPSSGYSEATAVGKDGFDVLDTFKFDALTTFPQQFAGLRVNAILNAAGWPAAERSIDTASVQSEVQAVVAGGLTGVSALEAIQAAAANDNGIFFIDGRGYAIFYGRHRQTDPRFTTSQATFCDAANYVAGRYLYKSAAPSTSKIRNDYRVTRAGGSEQPASDATSIGLYRRRTEIVSTLHTSDPEALNYAQYRVLLDKDPHRRYDEMSIVPGDDSALWLKLLQLGIGDRVTVVQSPPGGGAADTRDMLIEAVRATVGPGVESEWTFRLSPVSDLVGWVLGDAVYGLLGQTTVLTYALDDRLKF